MGGNGVFDIAEFVAPKKYCRYRKKYPRSPKKWNPKKTEKRTKVK